MFDLTRTVQEPKDQEFEVDNRASKARSKAGKNAGKSDASDEELAEEELEEDDGNRASNSPLVKLGAPLSALTPASEKALTPQNFSQAVHPPLNAQLVAPATPNHQTGQPPNSTISEVSSNVAQYQSTARPIGLPSLSQVQQNLTPASRQSCQSNHTTTQA